MDKKQLRSSGYHNKKNRAINMSAGK